MSAGLRAERSSTGFSGAHRVGLILLWAQVPILALVGVVSGSPLPEVALGILVPAAFALAGMAFRRPRLAAAAVAAGLVAASILVVGYSGGNDFSHAVFLLTICVISLYRDPVILLISTLGIAAFHLIAPPGDLADPLTWALVHTGVATAFALLMMLGWRVSPLPTVVRPGTVDLYRLGFQTAPIGMAVLRPSGQIVEVNRALVEVLGHDQAALVGANVSTIVHQDDQADLGTAWETIGNSSEHRATEWMRLITGSGRPIWGRISLSLVPQSAEGPAMVILQIEDVTHSIEEQRRLETLVRGKDEFVATLGDEIRDSLGLLIDLTDLADRRHVDPSDTLPRIEAQARGIASIVEDLVVSARADTDPVPVVSSQFDAGSLCREVVAASPDAGQVSVDVDATKVWADPDLTRHIVANLVANAVRYGGDTVTVRTVSSGPDTVFQVSDDGPEIPVSERERIFSGDLRTGQPVTRPAAVGLSLTVGRHLARLMDGDIDYHRIDGQNLFELRLPSEQISVIPRRIPA